MLAAPRLHLRPQLFVAVADLVQCLAAAVDDGHASAVSARSKPWLMPGAYVSHVFDTSHDLLALC